MKSEGEKMPPEPPEPSVRDVVSNLSADRATSIHALVRPPVKTSTMVA